MSDDKNEKPIGAGGPWKDPADEQKRADETTQTIARAMAEIAVRDLSTFYIDPCRGDDAMGAPGDRTRPFKTMPSLTHLSGGLHYNVEVIPCAGPFPCSCGQRSARNLPTVVTSSVAGLVDITADAQRVCIEILRADLARSERYALRDADERDALKKANEALRSDLNLVKDKLGLVYLASADDIIICIGERQTERAQALAEAKMLRAEVEELRSAVAAVCSTLGVGDGWTTGGIASRVTAMNQQRVAALQQLEAVNERICIPKDSTWSAQLNAIIQLHEKYEDVTGALHSLMDRDKESIRGSERYALRDAEERDRLRAEVERLSGALKQAQDMVPAVAAEAIGQHVKRQELEAEIEELREAARVSDEMRDHLAKRESIERVARAHAEAELAQRTSERTASNALLEQEQAYRRESDRRCEDARHALYAVYETLGIPVGSTTSDAIAYITAAEKNHESARTAVREAINERIGIPKNSDWNVQLNAVIGLHEKYEDLARLVRATAGRLFTVTDVLPSPARVLELIASQNDALHAQLHRKDDLMSEGARIRDSLRDQLAEVQKQRDEAVAAGAFAGKKALNQVLADVRVALGNPTGSLTENAARIKAEALQQASHAGVEGRLLEHRLRDMLGLTHGGDVVRHVESMADQIAELLRNRKDWTENGNILRRQVSVLEESLQVERVNYSGAMADCSEVLSIIGAPKGAHPVRAVRECIERLGRDRAAWAASSENALALQRELNAAIAERDANAKAHQDMATLYKVDISALGRALGRQGHETVLDAADRVIREHDAATAAALAVRAERDALTRQMVLRRELQSEADSAMGAWRAKCRQAIESCANIAQETAHGWELRALKADEHSDYAITMWARTHAGVARDIETKIRALLEAK